jgi:hypothetical protein
MCPDAPFFIILLCLVPGNFTCQGMSAATQWIKNKMHKQTCYQALQYYNLLLF